MGHFLALMIILSGISANAREKPHPLTQNLKFVQCAGSAAEYAASVEAEIVLNRLFLPPATNNTENFKTAIMQQLRYFSGYFATSRAVKGQVVLSSKAPAIEILKVNEITYPRQLTIDWTPREDIEITDPYIKSAIARASTSLADKAFSVRYRAKFTLVSCGGQAPVHTQLSVPLPMDPYLFYWIVPPEARRNLSWGSIRGKINPCADVDVVDYPDPYYFWYFWDPFRSGVDDDNRPFDCKETLLPGSEIQIPKAELEKTQEPKPDFKALQTHLSSLERPLSMTALFGFLDHHVKEPTPKEIVEKLGLIEPIIMGRQTGEGQLSVEDSGFQNFLRFVAGLRKSMKIEKVSTEISQNHVLTHVEGRLNQSHKPLRLRIYIGPTDLFGNSKPEHWETAFQSLATDDIIFYGGHSGLGGNFNLSNMQQHLNITQDQFYDGLRTAPAYQIIAFFSCISYTYFGEDLIHSLSRSNRKIQRDFVYTGIPFTNITGGALATLDLIDRELGQPHSKTIELNDLVTKSDYLVFESVGQSNDQGKSWWTRALNKISFRFRHNNSDGN